MTAAAVLAEAQAAGVQLDATPEGKLRWRCPGPLPEALRQQFAAHKAELLALLAGPSAWDPAEAERLLAGLRVEVEQIRAGLGSPLPEALANVLADALAIAEGYVVNHEAEAARGWDALELLRGMIQQVRCGADRAGWERPGEAD